MTTNLPISWNQKELKDVAIIERKNVKPENISGDTIFIGLEHMTSFGGFTNIETVQVGEIASNKFSFNSNHILYGKLRPYLRKITRPEFSGICSTDILPILPCSEIDKDYLYHYLRQQEYVDLATTRSSGANLPRVSPKTLETFPISFPPLEEQKRIAAILDKADRVRRKRQEAIRLTEELGRSIFLDMFSKYFETRYLQTFEDVSEVLIDCRNKTAPYADEGIPLIRTTNFKNYRLDLSELKYITQQTNQIWSSRHQTAPGDIVYCREAPYGMAATVPSEFYPCLGQRIMVSRPNQSKVLTEFLLFALNSSFVYRQALKVAIGSTVKHLRVVDVKGLNIPVAPLNEQEQFQRILSRCEKSCNNQILQKSESENLFNSLLQRAFRGEL